MAGLVAGPGLRAGPRALEVVASQMTAGVSLENAMSPSHGPDQARPTPSVLQPLAQGPPSCHPLHLEAAPPRSLPSGPEPSAPEDCPRSDRPGGPRVFTWACFPGPAAVTRVQLKTLPALFLTTPSVFLKGEVLPFLCGGGGWFTWRPRDGTLLSGHSGGAQGPRMRLLGRPSP